MPLKLVVGLGNPGDEYARTRHNVGFMLLDGFPFEEADPWKAWKGGKGHWAKVSGDAPLVCLKPLEYMNLSGPVVRDLAGFHKIKPAETLVCYDDFALPFGATRMRLKGSSGGHNGMDSIIEQLGTQEIPRLRIGIGPVPARRDPKDFVLGRLSKGEIDRLEGDIFPKIYGCITAILKGGFEAGMNQCNAPEKTVEEDS